MTGKVRGVGAGGSPFKKEGNELAVESTEFSVVVENPLLGV